MNLCQNATYKMVVMKRNFWLISFVILGLGFSSCTEDVADDAQDPVEEDNNYEYFQELSLADYDIPATIMLPDERANIGASTNPEVTHKEGGFKWDIQVGPNFKMHIEDWGANKNLVAEKKKQLKDLEIYEINYIVDKPDFIIYELKLKVKGISEADKSVGVTHKAYHVFGEKVIDDITYEFRSPDEGFERMIIEKMAKSIRSVKEIKAS